MYRVRSYPFVFIENRVGKMVVIIASVMMQPYFGRIMEAMAELPSYGYRRVWALLRRQSEATEQPVVNAKRVYRVMREHGLLLERNQLHHWPSRHIRGVLPSRRAIDGGAQMASSFAAITVKNYVSRSPWIAAIGKRWTGRPVLGLR